VLRDFGIFGVSFVKGEANAVLVVDPDAVLPFANRRSKLPGGCSAG
jgi:hypothetical protein